MKKLFLIFCFLALNSALYSANVYFLNGGSGYVYTNGQTFTSNQDGYASVAYWIWADPAKYNYNHIGARFQDPDGNWSDWSDLSGSQGVHNCLKAGTWHVEGRVWVNYDIYGYTNYWMYTSPPPLYFYVVDNYAPAVPQNLAGSWTGNHPVISWTENTEDDMGTYDIQKMIVGETGWATVATVAKNITQWVDDNVSPAGKFDPTYTIKYKIKANDINGNSSSYSSDVSITGTTEYLWKKNIILGEEKVVDQYSLSDNYPNPFNPSTIIKFQIPENSFTSLIVYNALGEQVAELVNDFLGKGQYSVQFQASDLPSGLYLYKLRSGRFTDVKKMLLTK